MQNETDEFSIALVEHYTFLISYASSLTGNTSQGRDLVQETMMRALGARHLFKPGTNIRGWLVTICRNEMFNRYRKAKRMVADPDGDFARTLISNHDTENSMIASEALGIFEDVDPIKRDVVRALANGEKYDDIAIKYGIPVGTVKSRANRGRKEFQKLLKKRGFYG